MASDDPMSPKIAAFARASLRRLTRTAYAGYIPIRIFPTLLGEPAVGNCNNSVSFANKTRRLQPVGVILLVWLAARPAGAFPDDRWSESGSADAPSAPAAPGFYARLLVGPSYLALSGQGRERRTRVTAASFGGALALGRAFGPRLAAFFEASFDSSLDPQIQRGETWSERAGVSLTTVGLGVGGTYRLERDPASVSVGLGFSQVRAVKRSAGALLGHTRWGPTAHLTFGRSFAIGGRLGAGLAIRASVGRHDEAAAEREQDAHWLAYALGLLLSASFH